jgi:hypothetical protein
MSNRTITVAEVQPPGQGKKQATVKDTDGNYYGFFPDAGFIITAGDTYDCELRDREYRGKTYYTITAAKLQAASGGGGGGASAGPTIEKDEHIYVTGVVGRIGAGLAQTGAFSPTEIAAAIPLLTKAASKAYGEWVEAVVNGPDEDGPPPADDFPADELPPGFE